MKHDFFDIEMAYEFVSSQPPSANSAILDRETRKIYYLSAFGDSDEDLPDDLDEGEQYVSIPHQHDFDLGQPLVFRFINEHAPQLFEDVEAIFSRKGAYALYKHLLAEKGLLDSWYNYENERTRAALLEWCRENNIELDETTPDDAE